ncbi:MAG: fluoride efflux transporter CrcB [Alphaproteobacteria bacterium]
MVILQVALGGAIGASLRYLSVVSISRAFGVGFPYGTMFVNIVGSFLMGMLAIWLIEKTDSRFAPFLMTGAMGGFTTFSAYSLDAFKLMDQGRIAAAGAYMGGSVILAIAALFAGMILVKGLT